jgi:hypothetical protein
MTSPSRRWFGRLLLAVSLLKWTPLHAQDIELGGNAAFAGKVVVTPPRDARSSGQSNAAVSQGWAFGAGVEACAKCGDRFALFGEYSHWARPQPSRSAASGLTGMDIAGGGGAYPGPNPAGQHPIVRRCWPRRRAVPVAPIVGREQALRLHCGVRDHHSHQRSLVRASAVSTVLDG